MDYEHNRTLFWTEVAVTSAPKETHINVRMMIMCMVTLCDMCDKHYYFQEKENIKSQQYRGWNRWLHKTLWCQETTQKYPKHDSRDL